MELEEKVNQLPAEAGVYLFKDALGKIIYVGKAKSLRSRVRSYFAEGKWLDAKTGSLMREAADVETIVVDNDKEALALENNLIKQYKPRFNVLLRDDKTYPYVKFTAGEKYPRVYVTRRLQKDGSEYFGPYFPGRLAYRIVELIHRTFKVPSCTVDLTRHHPRPCLQYYIKRCHGPCVAGLTTDERYAEAARHTRLFLAGKHGDLLAELNEKMEAASEQERYEEAAVYRDLARTVEEVQEKQKLAAAAGDDTDIVGYHYEAPLLAVNVFHVRGGRVVDRREFFWEDREEFEAGEFLGALLKQLYLDAGYIPRFVHLPVDFEDRAVLEEILSERKRRRVEILVPQRGAKRALLELVMKNAAHGFEQRFRALKPSSTAIVEALEQALGLQQPPRRIESFDVSHLQGAETVASMVVWENGRMKKSDYRKFIIRTARPNDDFAALKEAVGRRYRRLQEEKKALPDLILIDGGLGQLHAAAEALEELEIINQPLAAIAKKEEIIYVFGQESEPVVLDRHSPVLHLVQQVRDETHRFAVTFHRQRRAARDLHSELEQIPGVGAKTAKKLLRAFGSLDRIRTLSAEELAQAVPRTLAARIAEHLRAVASSADSL
ncbi:MAG TPA: excinuclease ABC subunit UvrC [Candidatus Xenobia bacterium]|nr:excinuclease ABC subunit UvrC [Candidatus Xenobia bacterium]